MVLHHRSAEKVRSLSSIAHSRTPHGPAPACTLEHWYTGVMQASTETQSRECPLCATRLSSWVLMKVCLGSRSNVRCPHCREKIKISGWWAESIFIFTEILPFLLWIMLFERMVFPILTEVPLPQFIYRNVTPRVFAYFLNAMIFSTLAFAVLASKLIFFRLAGDRIGLTQRPDRSKTQN